MSETMQGLKERFLKWRSALKSKGLKVNLEKMKVMVCGSEGETIWCRIDPCGILGKRLIVNLVLCRQCNQWIHEKCSKLKKVTLSAARTSGAGEVQHEVMCNEVETVEGFCYLRNRLNASGVYCSDCKNKIGMEEIQRVW